MKVALRTGSLEARPPLQGQARAARHLSRPAQGPTAPTIRRVLVTGADGFIGAQIAATLRAHGFDVVGVVFRRAPAKHELHADLTVADDLHALPTNVDAIVNAAGVVDGDAPARRVFAINAGATHGLLRWAKKHAVQHFVQVSSVAVYGPLVLGTQRTERAPRVGMHLGLPYMRSKAQAESFVERSAVPYTLLRPPAVIGPGDTVLTRSLVRALRGGGLPLVAGGRAEHLVSLCFVEGLANLALAALRRGPLNDAVHALDVELSLGELVGHYASALRVPYRTTRIGAGTALSRSGDAGHSWLVASSFAGQHYSAERLRDVFAYRPSSSVYDAVRAAVWGL